jgi:hypothetical protein
VLVSNGPGELSTWVRPVAERLHRDRPLRPRQPGALCRLDLVLVPCPTGTGREHHAAAAWRLFERIVPARRFWWLLLRPARFGPWPRRGVVVFLGGDQFWTVLLSARLGYRHLTYAEWVARWPRFNDRIAAMGPHVVERLPRRWRSRCTVVGDLMADLPDLPPQAEQHLPPGDWLALLPGSKRIKLQVGMPFFCAVADRLARLRPDCRCVIPVAPTIAVADLLPYLDPVGPIARHYGALPGRLLEDGQGLALVTAAGTRIRLVTAHPAHQLLSQCRLALTTVGANTSELAALGLPMIVVVPTQHLEVMEAWDGLIGLLARCPGLGRLLGMAFTAWQLRRRGQLALPNIAAGRTVVPERVGLVTPEQIAAEAADWLASPERLAGVRGDLRSLRGHSGAVAALAAMVQELLPPASA